MTPAEAGAAGGRDRRAGLFTLHPLTASRDEAKFAIALDAREPYLDDHRPGGNPLFSTVMAIEAGVTGARFFAPDGMATVNAVFVYKPYVIGANPPHVIDLNVVRTQDEEDSFAFTLSSVQDGQSVAHLRAVVRFATAADAATRRPPSRMPGHFQLPSSGPLVNAAKVYELFFHGPSFQVIGGAQYRSGEMLCRLRQKLPDSHRVSGTVSQMAPRLIEFALQSAGLLEVACNGRMKIPDFIGSIERFVAIDVDAPLEIFAVASYGAVDQAFINVDIVDAANRLILRVNEYRTVVLPFSFSAEVIAALRARFHGLGDE